MGISHRSAATAKVEMHRNMTDAAEVKKKFVCQIWTLTYNSVQMQLHI